MVTPDQQRFFFHAVSSKIEQCFEDYFEQSMSSSLDQLAVMAEVRYNQCIKDLALQFPVTEICKYVDQLSVKCEAENGTIKVIYSEQLQLMENGEATFGAHYVKHPR